MAQFFNFGLDSLKLGANLQSQANDDSANEDVDLLDELMTKLKNDFFITQYAARNEYQKLVNHLFNLESDFPYHKIKQYIFRQMTCSKTAHQKNSAKAKSFLKAGDDFYSMTNFSAAIEQYGLAIKSTPYKLPLSDDCHLAKLYARRSMCFFLCNSLEEAEFDYQITAALDADTAGQCLLKVLGLMSTSLPAILNLDAVLISEKVVQLYSDKSNKPSKVAPKKVDYDPQLLSLWFDNRVRKGGGGGRGHDGAHFLCAKADIDAGAVVLEELPIVTVSCSSADCLQICAGCNRRLSGRSFLPCDACDEAAFCSVDCFARARTEHHRLECGLASYLRATLSPLGAILFQLYLRTQCPVEFSQHTDLAIRSNLPTDADVHFGQQQQQKTGNNVWANPSKLPKRSYQYRYFLLANEAAPKAQQQLNLHDLQPFEGMLALRESADNKATVLPQIADTIKMDTVLCESIQLLFALEFVTKDHSSISSLPRKHQQQQEAAKHRLKGIIEDYCRLYRLNTGQGHVAVPGEKPFFAQPILGTSFWPSVTPNVEAVFCGGSGTLQYRTTRPVKRFDKLTIAFPDDYQPSV